jgi:hypothetical protein
MTLMLIVMSATLTTLDSSGQNRRLNEQRNDAVQRSRLAMETVSRQLRNLAAPSAATPNAIDRAQATDFSFRTFDPNRRIVRYCLSTAAQGTAEANVLFQMLQTTATPGDYGNCIGTTTGWGRITRVSTDIVNMRTPNNTPIFTFNGDGSNTSTITNVRMQLLVDINAAATRPAQLQLSTGVALRNQNQAPTARFEVNPVAGNLRRFRLNATGSTDPENRTLRYTWYIGTGATYDHTDTSVATEIGTGPFLDHTFLSAQGNNKYFKLVVSDSNLTDTCPTQPGNVGNCPTAGPYNIP